MLGGGALLLVAALAGCASYARPTYKSAQARAPMGGEVDARYRPEGTRLALAGDPRNLPTTGKGKQAAQREATSQKGGKRLVIYTASLTLTVFKPKKVIAQARQLAKDVGGWMQAMTNTSIVLRVPAEKLDALLTRLSELGEVLSRNVHGQDVTERFFDLKIRLDNAEKVRKRLLALLEKATNVKESVAVERELGRVTEQIERFKGQLKFLSNRIAYSTITLRVHKRTPWGPRARRLPFTWLRQLGMDPILSTRWDR